MGIDTKKILFAPFRIYTAATANTAEIQMAKQFKAMPLYNASISSLSLAILNEKQI